MITPVPMSGRARGAWPLSHPPALLSTPNPVLSEHAFPAEIAQLSDGGNNMIYGTHEIRMDSVCMHVQLVGGVRRSSAAPGQ